MKFDYKKTNFLDLLDKIVNEKKILKFNDIIIKWHPNHIQSVNEMHRIKNFIKKIIILNITAITKILVFMI